MYITFLIDQMNNRSAAVVSSALCPDTGAAGVGVDRDCLVELSLKMIKEIHPKSHTKAVDV